jgi:hypothetical protein
MDPITIGIASGAASLLGGIFGDSEAKRQAKAKRKALEEAQKAIKENMYSKTERAVETDKVSDVYNTGIMNAANSSAVASGSVINKAQFQAAGLAGIIGQKAESVLKRGSEIDAFNKQSTSQYAQLQAEKDNITTPSFMETFLDKGVPLGLSVAQMGMQMNTNAAQNELSKKMGNYYEGMAETTGNVADNTADLTGGAVNIINKMANVDAKTDFEIGASTTNMKSVGVNLNSNVLPNSNPISVLGMNEFDRLRNGLDAEQTRKALEEEQRRKKRPVGAAILDSPLFEGRGWR